MGTTTSKVNIGGIILAGGKGTRMRQSKPLVKLGGVTLLERVVRTFRINVERDRYSNI